MTEIGHNSQIQEAGRAELKAFVERIERMEVTKREVTDDINDIYSEAKGRGYNTKVLKKLIALRRQDKDALNEENELLALYANAVGTQLSLFEV